nr:MAG TPA: Cytosine specific methyltransferase [Caudoviricetes sp.]
MKHLGDITKINGAEIEPVHCIIGGSPCQDLSVAGKRAGLSGERSGLFMEQVRIVKEMREKYGTVYPRFMVWENVPGALSSNKGRDFAAVLEETIRLVEPEAPSIEVPAKGWPTWGGYRDVDGRWSVAWRVHDAQYWGVPQRRRRIALVADFGGDTAHEILFERKGVSGDPESRGAAGEEAAEGFGTGADCAIPINDKATRYAGGGSSRNHDGSGNGLGIGKDGDPSPTITAGDRHIVCAAFKAGQGAKANGIGYAEECAPTLGAVSSGTNQCPSVLIFDRAQITSPNNRSTVGPDKPCPALHTFGEVPAVCYQMQGFGDYREGNVASSCKQRDYKDSTDLVIGIDGECNAYIEQYGTLRAHASGGAEETLMHRMVVRRLTPLECERLQGFPDGWTDIGDYTDSTGKKRKTSDSARYKALGNSIALPFWRWMFGRMAAYLPEGATLGSLFDGIGGFPLCWERINGAGSCRWASEIEEFPMAVTKRHFKEE